jgi:hypothetical protein
MGDFKSMLPDMNEITSIAGKLYKDVKNSVTEIIQDYKQKRGATGDDASKTEKTEVKQETVIVKETTVSAPNEPPAEPATTVEATTKTVTPEETTVEFVEMEEAPKETKTKKESTDPEK